MFGPLTRRSGCRPVEASIFYYHYLVKPCHEVSTMNWVPPLNHLNHFFGRGHGACQMFVVAKEGGRRVTPKEVKAECGRE